MLQRPSRRDLIRSALATGGIGLAGEPATVLAQDLAPTPACHDGDEPSHPQIEGPFYKPRSPERADLLEPFAKARVAQLSGAVLSRTCRPMPHVIIDLWHADEHGDYDEKGFRYRGHLLTDDAGRFSFRTIVPALYPGRTRHYHVKVISPGRQLLTTQLYFPNEPMNSRDDLFDPALLMRIADTGEIMSARFDFIINVR
jgi:protocatechuate 3,4-dioxygenase beta subunit